MELMCIILDLWHNLVAQLGTRGLDTPRRSYNLRAVDTTLCLRRVSYVIDQRVIDELLEQPTQATLALMSGSHRNGGDVERNEMTPLEM